MTQNRIVVEDLEYINSQDLPWADLNGKRILITGANGFLPAYMVETLLYRNQAMGSSINVVALVRNLERAKGRFSHLFPRRDLSFVVQDVCDEYQGPRDIDFIVHAASQASPKYLGTDPVGTFESNVFGLRRMLSLARDCRAKSMLFFSSGEVYGTVNPNEIPTREDRYGSLDPLNVRCSYGEAKRAGESLCICWEKQYGVPVKIVRPFHTYGPGMALDDGRIFADFVADVIARRNLTLKSDGSATRAFCYLADATAAFLKILLQGENGQAYNVGSQAECSMRELAELLCRTFSERNLSLQFSQREPGPYLVSTISRSAPHIGRMRALGWEPRTSLADGFLRTVQFFESEMTTTCK